MAALRTGLNRLLNNSLVYVTPKSILRTTVCGFCTANETDRKKKFLSGFNDIPELHSANEMVQRIFSIDHANERDKRRVKKDEIFETYSGDVERIIAEYTMRIKLLLSHCQANRQDKENKVFFIWLIDQRKKLLKKLKKEDPQRYSDIVEELNIPPLTDPHENFNKYKFRKYKINVPLKKKRELHEFEYDRNY